MTWHSETEGRRMIGASLANIPPYGFVNTSGWIGAEYTPASASNQLWWHEYDAHANAIDVELSHAKRHLGFTALRMFLHSMVWEADGSSMLESMDKFLAVAETHGVRVGFVFFDDCWNHNGASLQDSCEVSADPNTCSEGCCVGSLGQKECCMNCWFASPQDLARTSTDRFEPYVRSVVRRFRRDPRVLWWETFNEPAIRRQNYSDFSYALRSEAYRWAKAEAPDAPVIACWDDHNATDGQCQRSKSGPCHAPSCAASAAPSHPLLLLASLCCS